MLENGNLWLYTTQFIITISLTTLAIWLFFNIKYENREKKWFQYIISGIEWNPVIKSIQLYKDIEEFKHEA